MNPGRFTFRSILRGRGLVLSICNHYGTSTVVMPAQKFVMVLLISSIFAVTKLPLSILIRGREILLNQAESMMVLIRWRSKIPLVSLSICQLPL